MNPNKLHSPSSSPGWIIGRAAFGLALFVSGAWLYRRSRAASAAGRPQAERESATRPGDKGPVPGAAPPPARDAHRKLPSGASQENLLLQYFVLVFVISIPIWWIGGAKLPLPVDLPLSALQVFNPLIAAAILSYRRYGWDSVRELFKKALDYQKIKNKIWYLPTLLLMPLIYFLSYGVMRLAGLPLPDPKIPWLLAPVYFLIYWITAAGEELGWTGFAIDRMQNRWGALKAALVLGIVWAVWHLIPDVQNRHPANWIFWHRLNSVAIRVLIVWIYNHTGKSVFAAILFHAMDNVSWSLFPNNGSHYNPLVTSLITWLAVGFVIIGWGPKRLARIGRAGGIR